MTFTSLYTTEFDDFSGTSGDWLAVVKFDYGRLCIDFNHDASQTTFSTGEAVMLGGIVVELYNSSAFVTASSTANVPLTLTVSDGTYDPLNSTGTCVVEGTFDSLPLLAQVGAFTAGEARVTLDPMTAGDTYVAGSLFGTITLSNGPTTSTFVALELEDFTVVRNEPCGFDAV